MKRASGMPEPKALEQMNAKLTEVVSDVSSAFGTPTIYAKGGHGFGVSKQGLASDTWIDRLSDWLGQQGFIKGSAR